MSGEPIPKDKNSPERKKLKRVLIIGAAALVIAIAVALITAFFPPIGWLSAAPVPKRGEGELRLHFVDVGQGDCTIVEFPEGEVLIVDAGDGSFVNENALVRYLKGLSPSRVTMLATHADLDHYGGFSRLIDVWKPSAFYLPALGADTKEYGELLAKLEKEGCETKVLSRYGVIEGSGGAYLVCLSPYSREETDENDASTVLYLEYGGVRAVLSGDISDKREKRLAAEYAIDGTLFDKGNFTVRLDGIDLLKVAHHGSDSSTCGEWLSLLSPKTAVISCGRGNSYRLPSGGCLDRLGRVGCDVYRTDELGTVMFTVKEGTYTITTEEKR